MSSHPAAKVMAAGERAEGGRGVVRQHWRQVSLDISDGDLLAAYQQTLAFKLRNALKGGELRRQVGLYPIVTLQTSSTTLY